MTAEKLRLVLCWHMHQPQYRDAASGDYLRPWTWLHGLKDYTDMAAHLETVPGAKAVVNFSTILLEQLKDYAARIAQWQEHGSRIGDPLLDALGGAKPQNEAEQLRLVRLCLHAHENHMIKAFEPYASLVTQARDAIDAGTALAEETFRDLLVWYHLAWTGESLRRDLPLLRHLLHRREGFSEHDARTLLELVGEVLRNLIPRYRNLSDRGRVELSLTPHAHPILPLLIDLSSAREAMPEVDLPDARYQGGEQRCRWHLNRALELFERHFGRRPEGCWPSEGGVSEAVLPLLYECGFSWTATGTNVLRNTLSEAAEDDHMQLWQATRGDDSIAFFFRDDELSDRIGFEYSRWGAEEAVNNMIGRLEDVRREWTGAAPPVVSIIMDGENAWEHFPYNAWFFLQHLYSRLALHPDIELTTFSSLLGSGFKGRELPPLVAGSWVYGDFSIWVGDAEKNRAWELLCAAKETVDRVLETRRGADREQILEQLGVCEASDWFWWLGGGNTPVDSAAFADLLRKHLLALYQMIGKTAPEEVKAFGVLELDEGTAAEAAEGAMHRANR